jgi:VanZ family protein
MLDRKLTRKPVAPHFPVNHLVWRIVAARLTTWAPAVLWAALIFALSSVPDLGTELGQWDTLLRKLAHVAEYAILGALVYRAAGNAPVAVLLASAYAATDEVHQAFVTGRHGSPVDWAIDTVGVVLGVAAVARLAR